MTDQPQTPTLQPEELTPEQLDAARGGEGGGAGKVNVQDLSFSPYADGASNPPTGTFNFRLTP